MIAAQSRASGSVILGVRFDLIGYAEAVAAIHRWRQAKQRKYVTVANPHSLMLCRRDPEMKRAMAGAALTLADGVGIAIAARLLGWGNGRRATGPALMLALCDWGRRHGYRHYFYGGREGVAEMLAAKLTARYAGLVVAGTYCPPFRPLTGEEDAATVDRINAAEADVVWVGLGAPKQEKWMAAHCGRIKATAMIGVGAAFDFHAGTAKWAPAWVRKMGLEWAYRLVCDPQRMWRRNLDSPLFLAAVIKQRVANAARPD
jgi:N-acetylglucosaminyldiphosphoundecaprenol N-acetyl-beta-D-mannosaminyltransferase